MRFAWIFIVILAVYWCAENSTNIVLDDQSSVSVFEQIPGCLQSPLLKVRTTDYKCFDYNFHENLALEFCLPANCCPDSNRFDHSYTITLPYWIRHKIYAIASVTIKFKPKLVGC